MRTFGIQGPVNPYDNYIVRRAKETADFIKRIKNRLQGKKARILGEAKQRHQMTGEKR